MVHAEDWKAGFDWYAKAFPNAQLVQVSEYDYKYLLMGDVAIEIVQADEKVSSGAAGTVVYWHSENFDERLRYLQSIGASLYRGPKTIEGEIKMCQVKDPFGNLIGIRGR